MTTPTRNRIVAALTLMRHGAHDDARDILQGLASELEAQDVPQGAEPLDGSVSAWHEPAASATDYPIAVKLPRRSEWRISIRQAQQLRALLADAINAACAHRDTDSVEDALDGRR